jgi:nickel-type superoxide dismutase maturation protease
MSPTLRPEENVLVNRLSYLFAKPKTCDIVALKDPRDKKILIKRISEIKNNKYFVLGDNKTASTDSRTFGWISKKDIIGKVIFHK